MGPDPITIVYRSCDPERPLEADDKRYVPLSEARGEPFSKQGGWRHRIAQSLRRADHATTVLVSGFVGDGKSTELKRLQHDLTKSLRERFAVVYVDAGQYLNAQDYSFTEVLLAIIAATGEQLRKDYGVELLQEGYVSRKMREMKAALLSEGEGELLGADTLLSPYKISAKIALKARAQDVTRKQLWAALSGEQTTLVEEFGKAIEQQARPALRAKGYQDLVIIIDWLEKLVCKPSAKPNEPNSHEELFLHHAPLFQQLGSHLVLTVPIEMVYSPAQGQLTYAYGREPQVISSVRVADFLPEADRKLAYDVMCQLLTKRFEDAPNGRVEFHDVFSDQTLAHDLIHFSGGHPRSLLILVRECLSYLDALPITRESVDAAKKHATNNAARKVREGWFEKLAKIVSSHQIENDDDHLAMLRTRCILPYANGQPLYAVDPAVGQLMKLREFLWTGIRVLDKKVKAQGMSDSEIRRIVMGILDEFRDTVEVIWASLKQMKTENHFGLPTHSASSRDLPPVQEAPPSLPVTENTALADLRRAFLRKKYQVRAYREELDRDLDALVDD